MLKSDFDLGYYDKQYVSLEMIKACKDREVSALGGNNANIRGLKLRCVFDFQRILKVINWKKHRQNLYRSVAKVKNIPEFTFNPKERSSQTGEWFKNKMLEEVYEYDLFLDFDSDKPENIPKVLGEVKEVLSFLNDFEVPYYVLWSGSKGFQVIIDGKYLPIESKEKGVIQPHKKIAERLKEVLGLKYLDLRNNGVPNRLCKIPYSIVKDKVAFPLTDLQLAQLTTSSPDILKKEELFKIKIFQRGLLEREGTIKGVKKFISELNFK